MHRDNTEAVFKTWLQEHSGIVFKVARAYTFTDEDRKDLVQDILLQLWISLPQFEGKAKASTWVYRVALNTALASHRKSQRRRDRQIPLLEVEDVPAVGNADVQRLRDKEVVERLYTAIRQLSKADAALVLLYLDDMSYREMAEVLGISENNLGVKLSRVRKQLAELMKE